MRWIERRQSESERTTRAMAWNGQKRVMSLASDFTEEARGWGPDLPPEDAQRGAPRCGDVRVHPRGRPRLRGRDRRPEGRAGASGGGAGRGRLGFRRT